MHAHMVARALLVASSLTVALVTVPVRAAPDFVVIVHPSNPATTLQSKQVSGMFLKQLTHWPNGTSVKPIRASRAIQVHEAFCRSVLKRSAGAVQAYWTQLVFSGREVPPAERPSEREVVSFVASTEGAIGVVGPDADTAGAKVVRLE